MHGQIGMDMPHGNAGATMARVKVDGLLFVTEMRLIAVHADEESIFAAAGCSRDPIP